MPDPNQDAIAQFLMGSGSPDMPMTPQTFAGRLNAFGSQQPGNVEDRRGEPNPWWNQEIGATFAKMFGIPTIYDLRFPQPLHKQSGKLYKDAGYYDIK